MTKYNTRILLPTTYERLGLLMLGCSPGGANSNFWVGADQILIICQFFFENIKLHKKRVKFSTFYNFQTAMFDGDLNLSVTMTFISSVGSFAFTTMWVYLLGAPMVGRSVPIPYLQLTLSLALFVLPLLLGILIQYKLPKLAGKLQKTSRPFFLICLIIFPVVGSVQNLHFFYLCGWQHIVAGAGLGWWSLLWSSVPSRQFLISNCLYFRISWLHRRWCVGGTLQTREKTSKINHST